MRNLISTCIIFYLLLHTLSARAEEICGQYLKSKDPVSTAQKLMTETNPMSQFCVGAMYFKGIGVKKSFVDSFKWVKKAADQNYPAAQTNLGVLLAKGKGVVLDKKEAFKWFLKAAQQGYAPGQFNLGVMYLGGYGINRNYIEAIKWFKKADLQGYKPASEALKALSPNINVQ